MESLKQLEAGDFVEGGVDEIVKNLEEENPDKKIDYKNINAGNKGYLAAVFVNGVKVAVVEEVMDDPMVKSIDRLALEELEEQTSKWFIDIERVIEVGASSEAEAIAEASDRLAKDPIRSEELKVRGSE